MGARPSQFKRGGGGFLNNVDGVISNYEFSDAFNGNAFVPGKDKATGKERFHSLYVLLSARVDGANEDVTTTLFAGSADDFEIEDDGHTVVPVEDGRELGGGTAWGKFVTSLVEAGFPESMLSEDSINFEPIIGTRVRFTQRKNVEDTKKLGKRKGKDGKEYDRQDLVITEVYDLAKPATKSNGKAAAPVAAKGKKAAPVVQDIKELAGAALLEIVQKQGGSLPKAKVNVRILVTPLLKGSDRRQEVQQWLLDDDNLEELATDGLISYDAKKGLIEAVEA